MREGRALSEGERKISIHQGRRRAQALRRRRTSTTSSWAIGLFPFLDVFSLIGKRAPKPGMTCEKWGPCEALEEAMDAARPTSGPPRRDDPGVRGKSSDRLTDEVDSGEGT